jgi:hypothetical protein
VWPLAWLCLKECCSRRSHGGLLLQPGTPHNTSPIVLPWRNAACAALRVCFSACTQPCTACRVPHHHQFGVCCGPCLYMSSACRSVLSTGLSTTFSGPSCWGTAAHPLGLWPSQASRLQGVPAAAAAVVQAACSPGCLCSRRVYDQAYLAMQSCERQLPFTSCCCAA